jgi:hypothetical protein
MPAAPQLRDRRPRRGARLGRQNPAIGGRAMSPRTIVRCRALATSEARGARRVTFSCASAQDPPDPPTHKTPQPATRRVQPGHPPAATGRQQPTAACTHRYIAAVPSTHRGEPTSASPLLERPRCHPALSLHLCSLSLSLSISLSLSHTHLHTPTHTYTHSRPPLSLAPTLPAPSALTNAHKCPDPGYTTPAPPPPRLRP